mmetsp:Transcript_17215/g.41817  ORF Transcript_17215/g.41817 Transcript_17215/m.41817 type:complete len:772 (-) Transcript_17215:81-2396(-)
MTTTGTGSRNAPAANPRMRRPEKAPTATQRMRRLSSKSGNNNEKGGFRKKNNVSTAPDLLAVVTSKPEMKERARSEAKARVLKLEQRRQQKHKNNMTSRTTISKPKHTPSKGWTKIVSPTKSKKKPSASKRAATAAAAASAAVPAVTAVPLDATTPKGNKKPSVAARAVNMTTTPTESQSKPKIGRSNVENSPVEEIPKDWTSVYQDIISPTSGKHKAVAKQDLDLVAAPPVAEGGARSGRGGPGGGGGGAPRVRSPKKKSRSLSPVLRVKEDDEGVDGAAEVGAEGSKSTLPGILPLDDSIQNNELKRHSMSSIKTPISIEDELASDSSEHEIKSPSYPAATVTAKDSATAAAATAEDGSFVDEYEDYEEEFLDISEFEDPSEQPDENETPAAASAVVHHDVIRSTEEFEKERRGLRQDQDMDDDVESQQDSDQHKAEIMSQDDDDISDKRDDSNKGKTLVLEFSMGDGASSGNGGGLQVPIEVLSFDELSDVDSWPSIDSEDSYETKMNKMMQRWVDIDGGQDADQQAMNDSNADDSADMKLDDNVLDHIVLAAPDLEKAMEQFEEMTGILPTHVGPLQGLGAKTAHIGLDNNRFIEILAPDEESPGPLGDDLRKLKAGTLAPYHYSIRSSEVSRLIEGYVYDVLGWDPDHIAMVQALPDNSIRQWDLLTTYGHDMGGCAPYYVKWNDPAQHPTECIPINATLEAFSVRAPEGHDVHKLIAGVGGLDVQYGSPMLKCTLSTPKGTVSFSAPKPRGLVFPGYEDEEMNDQ